MPNFRYYKYFFSINITLIDITEKMQDAFLLQENMVIALVTETGISGLQIATIPHSLGRT